MRHTPTVPILFDAHAHMYAEAFANDLEAVLQRAAARFDA